MTGTKTKTKSTKRSMESDSKKRGRPPKDSGQKEKPVSIRFPLLLLESIKEAANREGIPWQSFIKNVLAKQVGSSAYDA